MLCLSRKKNEIVVITTPSGERIEVMVVGIRGDKTRLGFTAHKSVQIHRLEVLQAIKKGESDDPTNH